MESFDSVVGVILNNWTALKIAVDHGMGGHDPKSKLESMVARILDNLNRRDVDNLPDLLEDILDDDFNTLLEDNSADEISREIGRFFDLWLEGRQDEVKSKMGLLPVKTSILEKYEAHNSARSREAQATESTTMSDEGSSNSDMEMNDEESEWTVVTRKR